MSSNSSYMQILILAWDIKLVPNENGEFVQKLIEIFKRNLRAIEENNFAKLNRKTKKQIKKIINKINKVSFEVNFMKNSVT